MNLRTIVRAAALLTLSSAAIAASSPADAPLAQQRLTPAEIAAKAAAAPASNTGVQTTNLIGDPTKPGLYTVRVAIAAHTTARPHTHRDNRSATVLSGTWHMGYGSQFDAKALKELPAGSVYAEPGGQPHFAQSNDEPVVLLVTGYGPSDTQFVSN
jgi:quercetin dioxygenase-like cupin family protein